MMDHVNILKINIKNIIMAENNMINADTF